MWTTTVLLALLLVFGGIQAISYGEVLDEEWKTFQLEYNKSYDNEYEEQLRRQIFKDNKQKMDKHNRRFVLGLETYEMGMNQFSDLLPKEFKSLMLHDFNSSHLSETVDFIYTQQDDYFIPESIDWRSRGAVTPVQNQRNCGSCWTFSPVGSLEGQLFVKTGQLTKLSEQNLLDCTSVPPFNNKGCNGGSPLTALKYILVNNGIDTYSSYPYEAVVRQCRFRRDKVAATVRAVGIVKSGSEPDLAAAVGILGPIAVAVDATYFQNYRGGVLNVSGSCSNINHAVTLVGYGRDARRGDFWLVKNSWGTQWGEAGYIRMSRNRANQCGIATFAIFPVI